MRRYDVDELVLILRRAHACVGALDMPALQAAATQLETAYTNAIRLVQQHGLIDAESVMPSIILVVSFSPVESGGEVDYTDDEGELNRYDCSEELM